MKSYRNANNFNFIDTAILNLLFEPLNLKKRILLSHCKSEFKLLGSVCGQIWFRSYRKRQNAFSHTHKISLSIVNVLEYGRKFLVWFMQLSSASLKVLLYEFNSKNVHILNKWYCFCTRTLLWNFIRNFKAFTIF